MSETPQTPATPQVTTDDLLDILTLGEIAQVEELAGVSIGAMGDPTQRKAPLLIAMACVASRRFDPTFSMNQAEALTGQGLNDVIERLVAINRPPTLPSPTLPADLAEAVVDQIAEAGPGEG